MSTLLRWLHHFQNLKLGRHNSNILLIATIHRCSGRLADYYSGSSETKVKHSSVEFNVNAKRRFSSSKSGVKTSVIYENIHVCTKISFSGIKFGAKNLMLYKSSYRYMGYHCFSTDTASTTKFTVDYNNIFSDENKKRVQKSLLKPQKQIRSVPKVDNPRHAGVLVPLCLVNQQPSILFMVRSREITKHKGEVCFPGGMMDPTDQDLTYTAIRETHEEITLPESCVDVWGHMTQVPSRQEGGVMVTPVLATCGEINVNDLILNPHEADDVFTCKIEDLCQLKNVGSTQFRTGRGFTLPVFHTGTYRVWGLTAIILHLTLTIIAPGLYKFKLRHRS